MAAVAKRPPLPAILLANDLLDGDVVFASAGPQGAIVWTRDPALSLVAAGRPTTSSVGTEALMSSARRTTPRLTTRRPQGLKPSQPPNSRETASSTPISSTSSSNPERPCRDISASVSRRSAPATVPTSASRPATGSTIGDKPDVSL